MKPRLPSNLLLAEADIELPILLPPPSVGSVYSCAPSQPAMLFEFEISVGDPTSMAEILSAQAVW